MSPKPVRSVLISDVDNTLFDWVAAWHAGFSAMVSHLVKLSSLGEATLLPEIRKVHQRVATSEYAFLIGELDVLREAAGDTPMLEYYAPAIEAYRAARQQVLQWCCQSNANRSPLKAAIANVGTPQATRVCHSARAAERRSL
jgi:FMN phosphatase YigB (HAD superfamily)